MNAAARLVRQNILTRHWVVSVLLTRTQTLLMLLTAAVLMSALSIIYVTNVSRNIHASIQQTVAERNELHIQWDQLLLEKSTWTMQARVEHVATNQMGMLVPDHKSVVIVNE